MKPIVAIALILGGVVVIGIPPFFDNLEKAQVFERMARGFAMEHSMTSVYRFGCFLAGALMILVAIIVSVKWGPKTLEAK